MMNLRRPALCYCILLYCLRLSASAAEVCLDAWHFEFPL
jgi:hypothetical protein